MKNFAFKLLDGNTSFDLADSVEEMNSRKYCLPGSAIEIPRQPLQNLSCEEGFDFGTKQFYWIRPPHIPTVEEKRMAAYKTEADPLKPEAEAELRQGRPTKYFEYMAKRFQIRRETEPEETKLALVKKDQISYWKTVCDMMIESKYPTTNMLAYKDLKDQAYAEGKLNRFAYLNQISTWGMALFQEFYTVEAYINAAPTVDFALAQAIDLTAWEAADPKVTFAGALAIAD